MSGEPFENDDPRLTAYALGEMDGAERAAERAEVEALLARDPAARAEVDAIRAAAGVLSAGFASLPRPALDPAHRGALEAAMAGTRGLSPGSAEPTRGAVPGSVVNMSEYSGLGALAATLLLVIGFGIAGASGGGPAEERNIYVRSFSAPNYSGVFIDDELKLDGDGATATWNARKPYVAGTAGVVRSESGVAMDPNVPVLTPGTGGAAGGGGSGVGNAQGDLIRWGFSGGAPVAGGGGGGGHQYRGPAGGGVSGGIGGNSGERNSRASWRNAGAGGSGGAAGTIQLSSNGSTVTRLPLKERMETVRLLHVKKPGANVDDVANGLDDGASATFDNSGVGVPFNVGTGGFEEWETTVDQLGYVDDPHTTEAFAAIVENAWIRPVGEAALSTFSIDVDTAAYAIVRRCLVEQNRLPPPGALRIEELVNYFPYEVPGPANADPFAVHVDAAACPWAPNHRLVRIALKGREVEEALRPAANVVLLLDVSGSMDQPNKLPLLKQSVAMLAERLTARDRIAIVVYAGTEGLALASTPGGDKSIVLGALERLRAGGSTNGGAGIELAYKIAAENFVPGGINRVVLATDGDFNVGVSDPSALVRLIEEKAKTGVFLTALGYGMDNLKDATLEQLADRGNGNYGYIDNLAEARKVLVEQGMSTLHCIAKDVKIQVEFNPARVAGYRLLGYENRMLAAQDFADDQKDAGEIGAGHAVTALYEVVPAGVEVPGAPVDELRYQRPGAFSGNAETLVVKLRWKEPEGTVSTPREFPFTDIGAAFDEAPADFRFAAAVAAFGMTLRDSKCAGSANLEMVIEIAAGALGADPGGYRKEFLDLATKARSLRK